MASASSAIAAARSAGSTAAAGAFNYSIAPADAWNQLIEVDGFGTDDWVTPSSATAGLSDSSSVGTPQVSVAQLSASSSTGETPGIVTINVPSGQDEVQPRTGQRRNHHRTQTAPLPVAVIVMG